MPKILIVDDEIHIRLLLQMTLEKLEESGVELLFAENGGEALEKIRGEKPDLVFLDVMMPVMSGFDVCRSVKITDPVPGVTVVLLTAKGQDIDQKTGMDSGADRYFTKPFDPDEVMAEAWKILQMPG